jgi:hypothetical protein
MQVGRLCQSCGRKDATLSCARRGDKKERKELQPYIHIATTTKQLGSDGHEPRRGQQRHSFVSYFTFGGLNKSLEEKDDPPCTAF